MDLREGERYADLKRGDGGAHIYVDEMRICEVGRMAHDGTCAYYIRRGYLCHEKALRECYCCCCL